MNDRSDHVNPSTAAWQATVRLAMQGSLHEEALAEGLGINPTDLRCVGLIWTEPEMTPGRLADLTGLTSGAVTGVLDRLERAGLVTRMADPADRRRTLVHVAHQRGADLGAAYDPLERAITDVLARYDESTGTAIADFLHRAGEALHADTARLRAATRGGMVGEMFTAPLGDAEPWTPDVQVRGATHRASGRAVGTCGGGPHGGGAGPHHAPDRRHDARRTSCVGRPSRALCPRSGLAAGM